MYSHCRLLDRAVNTLMSRWPIYLAGIITYLYVLETVYKYVGNKPGTDGVVLQVVLPTNTSAIHSWISISTYL